MANVLTRRYFINNLLKIKEITSLTAHNCTNIVVSKLDNEKLSAAHFNSNRHLIKFSLIQQLPKNHLLKYYTTNSKKNEKELNRKEYEETKEKLSLFQKFKIMYRDYWYVLVPVHVVTSVAWFGGFYFMAKSGIDIIGFLEYCHVSERLVSPFRDSSMGYFAISYALYKITTPARYTVTLGGTTISINYLKKWGYIKPVPSKERMKEIYEEKKETLSKSMKDTKEGIRETKENIIETVRETKEGIIEKKDNIIGSLDETKKGFKEKKNHIVKSVKKTKEILKKHGEGFSEKFSDIKEKKL